MVTSAPAFASNMADASPPGPPPMMIVSYILIEAADAVPSGAFALEASFLVCYFAVRADSSSYRTPPASAADVETGYFT